MSSYTQGSQTPDRAGESGWNAPATPFTSPPTPPAGAPAGSVRGSSPSPVPGPDEGLPGLRGSGTVTVRYWAGARAAATVSMDPLPAGSVEDILAAAVAARPALAPVVALCSVLVDGLRSEGDTVVAPGAVVDVLPPFAGG